MCCSWKLGVIIVAVFAVLLGVLQIRHQNKKHVFSHEEIASITKDALSRTKGQSVDVTLNLVESRLREEYGQHILPKSDTKWIFMNCGGWMGSMFLLHASLNEYVIFFGTGIDTSGHSGRYLLNISDILVSGTMRQWKEGGMKVNEYRVGDVVYHEVGEVTGVQWTSGTLMVEYGRGLIPTSLIFAFADTIFSTTDYYILYDVMRVYAKAMVNEIMLGNF